MSNKNVIQLIIVLFSIVSCTDKRNSKSVNQRLYYGFEFKMINHFPNKIDGDYEIFRNNIPENNNNITDIGRLFLRISNVEKIDTLYQYLNQKSIHKLSANDSTFIPLYFKDTLYRVQKPLRLDYQNYLAKLDSTTNSIIPFPNFRYINELNINENNFSRLPNGYKSYILGFNQGVFTEKKKYLMENSHDYFPKAWLHGIVKGVSVNKSANEVIYWVIYW